MNPRNRTSSQFVSYGLYLYFLGLSFRNTAKALSFLDIVNISHVSIWNGCKNTRQRKQHAGKRTFQNILAYKKMKRLSGLALNISGCGLLLPNQKIKFVAERFLSNVAEKYGHYPVSANGGGAWCPQACRFLKMEHHIRPHMKKVSSKGLCNM